MEAKGGTKEGKMMMMDQDDTQGGTASSKMNEPNVGDKREREEGEGDIQATSANDSTSTTDDEEEREKGLLGDLSEGVEHVETIELIAKWRGEEISLGALPLSCTLATIKILLQTKTRVMPGKQKLIGLNLKGRPAPDGTELSALSLTKKPFKFIFMGTPEEEVFIDPSSRDDLPDVFDDFDLDYTALSEEWRRSVANSENLKKFTAKTEVHLINPPRVGKRLLVLDLDHTLLDFSSREQVERVGIESVVHQMKRPHLDAFLSAVYQHYDLVVWSQTSWRWLEIKMVELGMLTHPTYRFCFVLDKTSMFHVESHKSDGSLFKHQVKPLRLIWSKFPHWNEANTVHIDDLSRNFALNQGNGIKIKAYYRGAPKASEDRELMLLGRYLVDLATADEQGEAKGGGGGREGGKDEEGRVNFATRDHSNWRDVAKGKRR